MTFNKKEESDVAAYYNKNTSRFMRFRNRKRAGTIHRRLYSCEPGNQDPSHYSESIILDYIKTADAGRILDLGSGIGASIRYLNNRHEACYSGITLSPVQHQIAGELGTETDLGSYLDTEWYRGKKPYDIIYAIESLQHSRSHKTLFGNVRSIMNKNSKLIVIDDFIIDNCKIEYRQQQLIRRFKKHWHAHGFISAGEFIALANEGGFKLIESCELTSLMKKPVINMKLRSAVLSMMSILPVKSPAIDNLIGGGTLIQLQQLKLAGYYKLVFQII